MSKTSAVAVVTIFMHEAGVRLSSLCSSISTWPEEESMAYNVLTRTYYQIVKYMACLAQICLLDIFTSTFSPFFRYILRPPEQSVSRLVL